MNTKYILVAGATPRQADGLLEWMNTVTDAEITATPSGERAIELAQQQGFDMVIINHSNENLNTKKLAAIMPILQPDVVLLPYGGEPSAALTNKIEAAFETRKKERIKRLLVLDSFRPSLYEGQVPFSLN